MQYTQGAEALLTATNKHSGLNIEVEISDLYEAFSVIQDPRRAQGRVYWLPSLLCLSVGAILCNCLSVLAISEWAEGLSRPWVRPCAYPLIAAQINLPCTASSDAWIRIN